jgi:threonine dehydrogenase-like Zn-dependent dehydrogenase
MQALRLRNGNLQLDPATKWPQPADGEVVVRIVRAGICDTDLQLVRGYMAFEGILGHEFVGIAETGEYAGRRVVGEINCVCRQCDFCRRGLSSHCPHRSVLGILNRDGAFAEALVLPQSNLHLVPDDVPTDSAVFTEPLAAAFQIPVQVPFRGDERVVVLGDGRLGNLCAQMLRTVAASVSVIGKHPEKLALLERMGIEARLVGTAVDASKADVVVDCTGNPSGLSMALEWVRPRGTIVLKTTVAATHTLSLAPVVIDEVTLVGSRCGPFGKALEALTQRRIEVEPLISAVFPLDQSLAAMQKASQPGVLKVLLRMD